MIGRNEKCPCGSGKRYKKCCKYKDAKNLDAFFSEVLPKAEYIDSKLYINYYRDTLKEITEAFSTIRVYYNENMEPVKYNMPVHDYIPKIRPMFKKFINLILQDDLPKDLKSICYCHIAVIIMNIYVNGLESLDKASHNLKIKRDLFYNRSIDNFITLEKECINRSIALCPNNTFALSILIDYYRATKDNMSALKTILSYSDVKESFDSTLNKYDDGLNNFKGDDILSFFISDLNDGYYDKSLNKEEVTNLLNEIKNKFKNNHEVVEAIEMKLVQSNIKIENNINEVLSNKDSK